MGHLKFFIKSVTMGNLMGCQGSYKIPLTGKIPTRESSDTLSSDTCSPKLLRNMHQWIPEKSHLSDLTRSRLSVLTKMLLYSACSKCGNPDESEDKYELHFLQ